MQLKTSFSTCVNMACATSNLHDLLVRFPIWTSWGVDVEGTIGIPGFKGPWMCPPRPGGREAGEPPLPEPTRLNSAESGHSLHSPASPMPRGPSRPPAAISRLRFTDGKLTFAPLAAALDTTPRSPRFLLAIPSRGQQTPTAGLKSATGLQRKFPRRADRAAARAARHVPPVKKKFLKRRSVTPATLEAYARHTALFVQYCSQHRLPRGSMEAVDRALEKYFDHLFFEGAAPYEGRYALCGYAFEFDLSAAASNFPRATRALKGWKKAAPEGSHPSMPWEAAVCICDELATGGVRDPEVQEFALSAARCLALQFDTYLRPDYAISLTKADLLAPTAGSNSLWTVMVRQSDDTPEGSVADLAAAAAHIERRRPGKTGEYDSAVMVGEKASNQAGRAFMPRLLRSWHDQLPYSSSRLFPGLNLPLYNKALRWATSRLQLTKLALVPHSARHGGASADFVNGHRGIDDIQARGLWRHPRSVARYKKPGLYNKQLAKMDDAAFARYRSAMRGYWWRRLLHM